MNNNSKQPRPEYKSDKSEVSIRYFIVQWPNGWLPAHFDWAATSFCSVSHKPICIY